MPWENDTYYYTRGTLESITGHYESLYTDSSTSNLYSTAESKTDFDRSLSSIGRGEWEGLTSLDFNDYKHFGKQQRVVIANILNVTDYKLEGQGFYDVSQLRGHAYSQMVQFLNETQSCGAEIEESQS